MCKMQVAHFLAKTNGRNRRIKDTFRISKAAVVQ